MTILASVLFVFLIFSVYLNYRLGRTVLRVQDALEESLDILDERHMSINMILQRPLYHDSPEIRKVLTDIEKSQDAILYIANELTINVGTIEVEEEA